MTAHDLAFNACEVSTKTLEKLIQDYARIQIEKDRERVEDTSDNNFFGEVSVYALHRETPIILD